MNDDTIQGPARLNLGLVGAGRWGRNIEKALLSLPGISVTVLRRGEHPPEKLDGVLIATQSASHAGIALPYIEAGIATFIEKPMTTKVVDAELICEAAGRSGAVVFVGHIFLHHPAFIEAMVLLPGLGAIQYLLCQGMNDRGRQDSSVLWDWLPHDLSMACAILGGAPDTAAAWSLLGGSMPRTAVAKFQFGDVALVSEVSWNSTERRRRLTVVGEHATLVFDDRAERKLAIQRHGRDPEYPHYAAGQPLTLEMAEFVAAVRSGKTIRPHLSEGMTVVRAIAAAEASIALGGQPVSLQTMSAGTS